MSSFSLKKALTLLLRFSTSWIVVDGKGVDVDGKGVEVDGKGVEVDGKGVEVVGKEA